MSDYQVIALPAFKDNYLWLLVQENSAVLVDPGDADICIKAITERNLHLDFILVTHHHNDHIGGLQKLSQTYSCPIYGPNDTRIPQINITIHEGSTVQWRNNYFRVSHLPGHTNTHLAYWNQEKHQLFCGDILFSVGCGRVFEGQIADLHHSLQRIAQLPKNTEIFCAHEYTLSNIAFALHIEPDNVDLQTRYLQVKALRAAGLASVPTLLDIELATNPFLRSHLPSIRRQLDDIAALDSIQSGLKQYKIESMDEYYFALMRLWKNIYV